jgi:4-hydroxy-2-oxoheptanedioate aldolase
MATDPVRARWNADETAFAAWLLLESPASADVLAGAGFDAVVVDLQHGSATMHSLPSILPAIESSAAVPFVRTAWNDPAELMRVLDLGVRGVICPMVGSGPEAEAFVRSCRYPPDGIRSYGPIRGALGEGRVQATRANEEISLFAMIETADGFANLEEIAATPGLTGLFVGPTDLGFAMGLDAPGDLSDPSLLELLDEILRACQDRGIVAGIHVPAAPRAAEMAARGFRLVSCAVDTNLLSDAAASALREARGSE